MRPLTLAFDIGGSNLRAALVDDEGRVVDEARDATGRAPSEEIAARARALAVTLEQRAGARAIGAGAGVAAMVPAPFDVIENAPNLGWRDAPFREQLSRALDGRPVVLVNDLDAIALGEQHAGAARGHAHVLFVYVGTGVGAGIVTGGALLRGARGVAAELGHTKVVAREGRLCGCGATGCLEAYTGGAALSAELARRAASSPNSALAVRAKNDGGVPTMSHADALAREGDVEMSALVDEVSDLLGVSIANAITILNPAILVLGGGVLTRCPFLSTRVVEKARALANRPAVRDLVVTEGSLGEAAGLIGAARAFALAG